MRHSTPGRRADLAAAAPRHLLHRGPGGADPRPEERQPPRAHQRQAGGRGRRRHHRRRRGQGARRRGPDQRPRRRHRRLAAHQHQARRAPVGAGPGRDPPDPGAQQPAQPHRRGDRRPAQDRPRRGHRGAARRRGVRLRHGAAGGAGLHHDARLPPQHLPGRRRHAGPEPAREVHRRPDHVVNFMRFIAAGGARADGRARLPHHRRDGRPHRRAGDDAGASITGRPRGSTFRTILYQPDVPARGGPLLPDRAGPRPGQVAGQRRRSWPLCQPAMEQRRARSRRTLPIRNVNRVVGTIVGSEVTRRYGAGGPARRHDPAALPGLRRAELRRLRAAGHDADPGRATPTTTSARACPAARSSSTRPRARPSSPEENIIIGNVAFYGATSGEATSAAWPASASASATAASTPSWKASATTAAST